MLSSHADSTESFKENRRSDKERRAASDRRDLIRFEDLGNERRAGLSRRKKGLYWVKGFFSETD